MPSKPKRGRPPHEPTKQSREQVELYVAMGTTQEDIARVMGFSVDSLARHYREELDTGVIKANAKMAQSLFRKGVSMKGPGAVTAAIFWLKTRARWKETTIHEVEGGTMLQTTVRLVDETARDKDG